MTDDDPRIEAEDRAVTSLALDCRDITRLALEMHKDGGDFGRFEGPEKVVFLSTMSHAICQILTKQNGCKEIAHIWQELTIALIDVAGGKSAELFRPWKDVRAQPRRISVLREAYFSIAAAVYDLAEAGEKEKVVKEIANAIKLGQRGYAVTLAEAATELGGRVTAESRLPGLNAWARVRDWRVGRIREMTNVEVYLDSELTAENILEFGFHHVFLATGAQWRTDGVGVTNWNPIPGSDQIHVLSPADIAAGRDMAGPVVVFDDDNFYLGGVVAEKLRNDGYEVTLVATAPEVSSWTRNTLEQHRIQARVLELGIEVLTAHNVVNIGAAALTVACIYTGRRKEVPAGTLVMITSRRPNSEVYLALTEDPEKLAAAGIDSVSRIGDSSNPSTIAAAVYDGHRAARELDAPPTNPDMPFRREHVALDPSV